MVNAFHPETLSKALEILAENPCTIMAGGTDLMAQKARGFAIRPVFEHPLLFINHIDELKQISLEDNEIHIGACATLSELLESQLIADTFKDVIRQMASPPIRNLATIGGNICNASPAADTLPYLYALDAQVEIQSQTGLRTLPIREFIKAPKTNGLQNNELLTHIVLPNKEFDINFYRKLGQRRGMSLTKASFHGLANVTNGSVTDLCLALGSVAPTIVRCELTEQLLIGQSFINIEEILPTVLNKYSEIIKPIDDARSTAKYRKEVSIRLIKNFLLGLGK
ncbi:MAG: FAD binding domain-containing protein [Candidatus Marinimicrobia bacterium]|nr:FAD binding domain-containing protein [Candidatus Neomarinimicrobiota bacterium]